MSCLSPSNLLAQCRPELPSVQVSRDPPRSRTEYTVNTTGRERREYAEWKKEREQIDRDRLERQKNDVGEWKREWDHQKNDFK